MNTLSFNILSKQDFDKTLWKDEENIKDTILEKYNTIIFDLDRTLWDCFTSKGEQIAGYQTIPPYSLQSKNIIVDIKGNIIQLQEGVRELLELLDNLDKNLGVVSRGQKLIDVDKRIEVPFSSQPSVMLLKMFDLYKYFNKGVILKAFEDKKFYVKEEGKTLFIDDDDRWVQSVNEREDIDVLNRKSFRNWNDLLGKNTFSSQTLSWKEPPFEVDSVWYNPKENEWRKYYVITGYGEEGEVFCIWGTTLEDLVEYFYFRDRHETIATKDFFDKLLYRGTISNIRKELENSKEKLSWKERGGTDEYVIKAFKELNLPLSYKDYFYMVIALHDNSKHLSKLVEEGTYDRIKQLVKDWSERKNLSFKQASPESYTDKSDIDSEFRNLNDWHWEDKNLPFLKDEFPGEDTHYYKKDPLVFQELDEEQGYAYNGVQASQKLSWQFASDAYYELEDILRKENYSFHREGDNIVIDEKDYAYLPSLTQLPDNVQFNNEGNVNLNSLTQLPDNVQFNNEGSVFLPSLIQLPDNVQFNNKGNVFLSSLTQLPDNKEQIFKNDGIVWYDDERKVYDPRTRKFSSLPNAEDITEYDISPLNEMNLYPSKRKDNYDYKVRNTKGDEEMIFEKGLHQTVGRPETNRDIVPYGSKLSWKSDIQEVVNDEEWQELRKSFVNTWKKTPEENIKKLRDYLGGMEDPLKLRRVHNYLTGSGFRIGVISHPEITKLLEEVREKRKENKKLSWKEPTTIHQDLMNEAYEIWQKNNWSDKEFIEKLEGTIHKYAVILGNLNYQVENGGWDQWWSNGYGTRDWEFLLTLLPQINTPSALQVLKILKKAVTILIELYDSNNNSDEEEEEDRWELLEKLDTLDDEYYGVNEQFMKDVDKFLLNTPGYTHLVISNQTYDAVDSQSREPEDVNFVTPFNDKELKRSNPPRYDKRKDIYQNVNENLRDSDVSNRFDQTSLTSGATKKLSWKIMSDVYYDFEELLRNNGIHFKTKDGVITIDHNDYVYLPSLTQLPENVIFNNKGSVNLSSLTQLSENTVFNNEGFVNLNSLTQLPDNVQFNNKGNVYLNSLRQLTENKEQIFKNDGIVIYDDERKVYDSRTRKLSFNKTSVDINEWLNTGIPFAYKRDSEKLYVGKRGQSHGELGKQLYDHGLKFTLNTNSYSYYPSDEEFLLGRVNSTKTKVGFYAKEDDSQIYDCLFELLRNKLISKDTLVYLDEMFSYDEEGKSVREIFSSQKLSWVEIDNLGGWIIKAVEKVTGRIVYGLVIGENKQVNILTGWFSTMYPEDPEFTEVSVIKDAINKFKEGYATDVIDTNLYNVTPIRKVIDLDKIANKKLSWKEFEKRFTEGIDSQEDVENNVDYINSKTLLEVLGELKKNNIRVISFEKAQFDIDAIINLEEDFSIQVLSPNDFLLYKDFTKKRGYIKHLIEGPLQDIISTIKNYKFSYKKVSEELNPPPGFIPTNKGMMTEEDIIDDLSYSSYAANRDYDRYIEPYSTIPNPDYDFEKSRVKWRNFWMKAGGWKEDKLNRFERRYFIETGGK